MEINIHKAKGCNIIEKVENGSTIIGTNYGDTITKIDCNNPEVLKQMRTELESLKTRIGILENSNNACEVIDQAIVALETSDESKIKNALKLVGRECLNIGEGIIENILATAFIQFGIPFIPK